LTGREHVDVALIVSGTISSPTTPPYTPASQAKSAAGTPGDFDGRHDGNSLAWVGHQVRARGLGNVFGRNLFPVQR